MAQQPSGELASTDPTKGEEDARVQERGVGAKISLSACSSPQHLQRPTSSCIGKNAPSLSGLSDADMARSRRRGVSQTCQQNCYAYARAAAWIAGADRWTGAKWRGLEDQLGPAPGQADGNRARDEPAPVTAGLL